MHRHTEMLFSWLPWQPPAAHAPLAGAYCSKSAAATATASPRRTVAYQLIALNRQMTHYCCAHFGVRCGLVEALMPRRSRRCSPAPGSPYNRVLIYRNSMALTFHASTARTHQPTELLAVRAICIENERLLIGISADTQQVRAQMSPNTRHNR